VITPPELGLWLLTETIERSQALQDLVTSRDLVVVVDGDIFTVARTHGDIISRMETGNFPLPLAALA
jgi:hypothetical protein